MKNTRACHPSVCHCPLMDTAMRLSTVVRKLQSDFDHVFNSNWGTELGELQGCVKHMRSQAADEQVTLLQRGVIEADVSQVLRGGDEKTLVSAVMKRAEVERTGSGGDVALSLGSTGAIIREPLACGGGT